MKAKKRNGGMFEGLLSLKGNAKYNILLQPLFSIPSNMYTTYTSLYMLALGMTTTEIGLVGAVGMVFQFAFSLISFYTVDKFGRKAMSIFGDVIGWTVPLLLWFFANNVTFFLIAAFVNASIRVNIPAYNCIMTEGYTPGERYHIFTWLQISNIIGWFFVPIGGFLVANLGVISGQRAMYMTAIVMMVVLIVVRLPIIKETDMGRQRIREMKGVGPGKAFKQYAEVIRVVVKKRYLMISMLMKAGALIAISLRNTYLAIIVTKRLNFADSDVSILMTINAAVLVLVLFFVMPIFNRRQSKLPILLGYLLSFVGCALLLVIPQGNFFLLVFAVILMAAGNGLEGASSDALIANMLDDQHRTLGLFLSGALFLILFTPISYLVGVVADINISYSFIAIALSYIFCTILYLVGRRFLKGKEEMNKG